MRIKSIRRRELLIQYDITYHDYQNMVKTVGNLTCNMFMWPLMYLRVGSILSYVEISYFGRKKIEGSIKIKSSYESYLI